MTVHVEGLRDFQRALRKADKDIANGLRRAFRSTAGRVRDRARGLAPRRTGRLTSRMPTFANQSSGGFKVQADHAGVMEFATKYNRRGRGGSHPMGPHTVTIRKLSSQTPRYGYRALDDMADEVEDELFAAVLEAARAQGWL